MDCMLDYAERILRAEHKSIQQIKIRDYGLCPREFLCRRSKIFQGYLVGDIKYGPGICLDEGSISTVDQLNGKSILSSLYMVHNCKIWMLVPFPLGT